MTDKMIPVPRELLESILEMLKRTFYSSPKIEQLEWLLREASHHAHPADDQLAEVTNQRDELLEALKVLCNSIETTENKWRNSSMHNMARAAIAAEKREGA